MKYANITQWFIVILLTISCAGYATQRQQHQASSVEAARVQAPEDSKFGSPARKAKGFAPDQVLVKFRKGTDAQVIEAIQGELHLQTIRIVSSPNLYLMKIQHGSSVQEIMKRLETFKAVEYSEPNYVRTIQ